MSSHRYLYDERQVNGDGLVYIRHPWESGMDNSPAWDIVLDRIDLSSAELPKYERKDTEAGVSADKPSRFWRQFGISNAKSKYSLKSLDPRIHFALVCGSRSCAPIKYYTPE